MKYRSEIDGLRALAVVPVIFFHAGFPFFSGGFVGVDVFFVISGYLITTIIITELNKGTFSISNFYERRARRILPALFFIMAITSIVAYFWLLPSQMKDFSQSLVATSLFSSNILFFLESGYWSSESELKPLLHTWSLAVEEQYYIFVPLFFIALWKYRKRWTFGVLLVIAFISFSLAEWSVRQCPSAAFYLIITRAWELAIGAMVAFFLIYKKDEINHFARQSSRTILEVSGFFLIVSCIFLFDEETPFPGAYALLPTIGTALIILFSSKKSMVGRILSTKAMVGIGLISYSAYLIHQPLMAFAKNGIVDRNDLFAYALLALISFPLAYLSWKYVEQPFRSRDRFSRKQIWIISISGILVFSSIGVYGHITNGFEEKWISRNSDTTKTTYELIKISKKESDYGVTEGNRFDNRICRFNSSSISEPVTSRIRRCFERFGKGYLILGDSHAIDLFGVVISSLSSDRYPFIVGITQEGCRPHTPKPECSYDNVLQFIKKNNHIFDGVVFEQAGFYLLRTEHSRGTRSMFRNLPYDSEVRGIYPDVERIEKVLKYLSELSRYVNVTWFAPRLEPHIYERTIISLGCNYKFELRPGLKSTFDSLDDQIETATMSTTIRFVSQNEMFSFSFPEDFMNCEELYWSDGDHFSAAGERRFGERLSFSSLFR